MPKIRYFIREGLVYRVVLNSRLARALTRWLYAITLWIWQKYPTIYVDGPVLEPDLHAHEFAHVRRWYRHGRLGFLERYIRLWIKFKYKAHPQELEAERDRYAAPQTFVQVA